MRKRTTTLLVSLLIAVCSLVSPAKANGEDCLLFDSSSDVCTKTKSNYIKLGYGIISTRRSIDGYKKKRLSDAPVIAVGRRYFYDGDAIDISASFGFKKDGGVNAYYYTLPKVLYLKYLSSDQPNSLYLGAGASWNGVKTAVSVLREERWGNEIYTFKSEESNNFQGIALEAVLGYEMARTRDFRSFVELNIGQPLISAYKKNGNPGPSIQLFFGIGV